MAVNKVVYGNTTLMDLTEDTVASDTLLSGVTAHDKSGALVTGTVTLQTFRVGTSEPSNSPGVDGDLYLVVEG